MTERADYSGLDWFQRVQIREARRLNNVRILRIQKSIDWHIDMCRPDDEVNSLISLRNELEELNSDLSMLALEYRLQNIHTGRSVERCTDAIASVTQVVPLRMSA